MTIKRTWLVVGETTGVEMHEDGSGEKEYATEKKAVARAKILVQTTEDTEAWVYGLTHVISRPEIDPVVDVVK